ncbi:sigma-70 family RNA polymerase sigma factor [Symbiobacterium thermophilum]|uniref:sigma-70 family RNA polymerase sigma factor n=1 Tax=Symbiobacterium thermophilum TaxID=2734 RepID=UPI002356B6DE|nr:sigma-70 family RNA polymerase sigma factor [Symbiobacterium thermophilum]
MRYRREGPPTHRPEVLEAYSDEQRLVLRAQRDPEAFGELYDMHFDRIYAYIHRKTGDRQVAEDLTADTFLKALAHIQHYRYTGQPFAAWLYRIAANVVIDYYRVHRPTVQLDEGLSAAGGGPEPEEAALALDDRQAVSRALQALSPDQQDVVLMRFAGDMKLKDIAAAMGKTEGAVKALLFRALNTLRRKLSESGVQP